MKVVVLFTIILIAFSQIDDDIVENPPGMINSSKIYSGYLDTSSETRKIHYVFVEAQSNPNDSPVVLWLNGGPGCSSLLGFLMEIGSFVIQGQYVAEQNLTKNQYGWSKIANILYLQSPAGIGFSTNTQQNFRHNDTSTLNDTYTALRYFFEKKGTKWIKNNFYIAGSDYAGKYIPDLALKILQTASEFPLVIQGILIGNGYMNLQQNSLIKSQIQYMNTHNFLNPTMMQMYHQSCEVDFQSPRCKLFKIQYESVRSRLNSFNVYQVCRQRPQPKNQQSLKQIPACVHYHGLVSYLNINQKAFNIKQHVQWHDPCFFIHYDRTARGSLEEYKRIMLYQKLKIWLYSGDADDVVPFEDTLKNLPKIGAYEVGTSWYPWFANKNHAGFYQHRSGNIVVATVKGSGHLVAQSKKQASYQIFYNFINNRPFDQPL